MTSPKLMAAILGIGMLILAGGAVFAATQPTWHPSKVHTVSSARPSSPSTGRASAAAGAAAVIASATAHAASVTTTHAGTRTSGQRHGASASGARHSHASRAAWAKHVSAVTYTVKPGDTLSGIAHWFKFHGYGKLFETNRSVIGANPNLIFPGQRITIRNGVMSLRGAARRNGSSA